MTLAVDIKKRRFNVDEVRDDFPILKTEARGHPLVYLDNAATTQKPGAVIDAITSYYTSTNANIHRAVHYLSEKATAQHDTARETVRRFINAASAEEIIFVRGTTEALNLVASSYGGSTLQPGDTILISGMEHHSNIVPWQLVAERTGAQLQVIPIDNHGILDMNTAEKLLRNGKTRILSVVHVSNALGTVNPVEELIRLARANGVTTVVDGAQAVPHIPVDVQELQPDFYAFSGHKIYGPTGIGILYGRSELLQEMPPYQGGGDMIRTVSFGKSTWNTLPYKFEAGTPDICGAIGLSAALQYVNQFKMSDIELHEKDLISYTTERLSQMPKVEIIGRAPEKAGAVSFVVDGVHPHDLGTFIDQDGIAIRTGHHCAQPVMEFFSIPATARLSFGMYNNRADVDAFCTALDKTVRILS